MNSFQDLDNYKLENENPLTETSAGMIINFLEHLRQPVVLVAHNGNKFDFPLLKKELKKLSIVSFCLLRKLLLSIFFVLGIAGNIDVC